MRVANLIVFLSAFNVALNWAPQLPPLKCLFGPAGVPILPPSAFILVLGSLLLQDCPSEALTMLRAWF